MADSFNIRIATLRDLELLLQIERECWGSMAVTKEELESRIISYPTGQLVAVTLYNNLPIGVIYSQRLDRKEVLLEHGSNSGSKKISHSPNGKFLHLLSVTVVKEKANLQVGTSLRNQILEMADKDLTIDQVIAVTRCSKSKIAEHQSDDDYNHYVLANIDPTIRFHTSAGAKIIRIISNYRPDDVDNMGRGVLVEYPSREERKNKNQQSLFSTSNSTEVRNESLTNRLSLQSLKAAILTVIDPQNRHPDETDAIINNPQFLTTGFMSLGLDSLQLMELRNKLITIEPKLAESSPTMLFDLPTPGQLLNIWDTSNKIDSKSVHRSIIDKQSDEIAIIGMSCRLPGQKEPCVESFVEFLMSDNLDCMIPVPTSWKCYSSRVGLIENKFLDTFDFNHFGISRAEAIEMDPTHRILLEICEEALGDASLLSLLSKDDESKPVIGVFVGQTNNEWINRNLENVGSYTGVGVAQSMAANRISYTFGLTGPSVVIDSACSSSLVAVHSAVLAIKNGDCDIAIVASADIIISSFSLQIREAAQMLAKDGVNKTFDSTADGYVRGEGAVAIILSSSNCQYLQNKPLAYLLSSAVNQDGRSASLTAPSGLAQKKLLERSLSLASFASSDITYIETHGTGTALGDPIEFSAIRDVYLRSNDHTNPLVLGALKTRIGHLESTAGLAGLLKVIISLQTGVIPMNSHLKVMNPLIKDMIGDGTNGRPVIFPQSNITIDTLVKNRPVIAAVSSFGSGGTNAHVIIRSPSLDLDHQKNGFSTSFKSTKRIGFLFTGQGDTYWNLGKDLFHKSTVFRNIIVRITNALPEFVPSLSHMYESNDVLEMNDVLTEDIYKQLFLFSTQVGLCELWREEGIVPVAVAGHSFGEFAALVGSNILDIESAARLVLSRAKFLVEYRSALPQTMVAVRAEKETLVSMIKSISSEIEPVTIAAINTPNSIVLSGTEKSIDTVLKKLNVPFRGVKCLYAYHSPLISKAAERFEDKIRLSLSNNEISFQVSTIPFISCLTGLEMTNKLLSSPSYWSQQMTNPVQFTNSLESLSKLCDFCIEIGPTATLTKFAKLHPSRLKCFPTLNPNIEEFHAFTQTTKIVLTQSLRGGRLDLSYNPQLLKWRFLDQEEDSVNKVKNVDLKLSSLSSSDSLEEVIKQAVLETIPFTCDELSLETSFLSMGIDSLGAVAIRNSLHKRLSLPQLPSTLVLTYPTIRELVEYVSTILQNETINSELPITAKVSIEDKYYAFPTTRIQQGMLFHHLFEPKSNNFVETFCWEITGSAVLDSQKMMLAWISAIGKFSSLRSSLDPTASPVATQKVSKLENLNLNSSSQTWFREIKKSFNCHKDDRINILVQEERVEGIDPTRPLLLRVTIVHDINHLDSFLLLTIHHTVIDGTSLDVILKYISQIYASSSKMIELEFLEDDDYKQVSNFEQQYLEKLILSKTEPDAKLYFKEELYDIPSPQPQQPFAQLKADASDKQIKRIFQYLSNVDTIKIVNAAKFSAVTVSSFTHAAWRLVLKNMFQKKDFVYGSTFSGRNTIPNSSLIVGAVINTLPLRVRLDNVDDVPIVKYIQNTHKSLVRVLEFERFPLSEAINLALRSNKDDKLNKDNFSNDVFVTLFDYQKSDWSCNLLPDGSLSMINGTLYDKICTPLSLRIIHKDSTLRVVACSECLAYDLTFLKSLVRTFIQVLNDLASKCGITGSLISDIHIPQIPIKSSLTKSNIVPLAIPSLTSNKNNNDDFLNIELIVSRIFASSLTDLKNIKLNISYEEAMISTVIICSLKKLSAISTFHCDIKWFDDEESTYLISQPNYPLSLSSLMNVLPEKQYYTIDGSDLAIMFTNKFDPYIQSRRHSYKLLILITKEKVNEKESIINVKITFNIPLPEELQNCYQEFASKLFKFDLATTISILNDMPLPIPSDGPILPVPITPLHSDFLIQAHLHSAELAISQWDTSGSITRFSYLEISYISRKVCDKIEDMILSLQGSPKDTYVVAVVMDKGWEQVAATLGCLRAGCAYLPIDIRLWPEQRVRHVLKLSETNVIVSQKDVISRHPWLHEAGVLVIDVSSLRTSNIDDIDESMKDEKIVNPNSIAYLIYTSGSTGVPKGVCCHHRGTMNTITDLNSRFEIGIKDKVLALSSLSFDLSVYDIFGMLSAGGTVVIPPASSVSPPDPEKWLEIVIQEEITLWNTVPAFLELLISHCEYLGSRLPSSLRLVYLSGDWIPLTLPSRVRAISDNSSIRIISMGGATEAAIWSNIYEIGREGLGVPEGWSSVPYGRPLRNQSLLVLDDQMRHCEVWVTGYLHLGGVGVAQGYYRDPDRTAYQFVKHPVTGETLFRTGDLGRVRPGGLVEILGREDAQVKVNGFRVELGEIERALMTHNSVKSAAVAIHRSMLCAYVVLDPKLNLNVNQTDATLNDLRDLCKDCLPDYMCPRQILVIDKIPLSSNGKVDRQKLPSPPEADICNDTFEVNRDNDSCVLTKLEDQLKCFFQEVLSLPTSKISISSNFFSLGGDSLKCVRLVAMAIKNGIPLTVPMVFLNPTIQSLTQALQPTDAMSVAVESNSSIFPLVEGGNSLDPFPLIGINQAHFVGLHTSSFSAGAGLSPQIYFEWTVGDDSNHTTSNYVLNTQVDVKRLEKALNRFISRHPTFRSVITPAGQMRILERCPIYSITDVYPWTGNSILSNKQVAFIREYMTRNGPGAYDWPLFEVRVTHTGPHSSVIHVVVSLFLMDAMSDLILRHELSELYMDPEKILPPPGLSYRDYSISLEAGLQKSKEYLNAKSFWFSRLDTLFPGPALPRLADIGGYTVTRSDQSQRFMNLNRWLSKEKWKAANKNCLEFGVTMPSALLACYALALNRWTSSSCFLLNVLQCLRHPVHPTVNDMVGNCSSTILCNVDLMPRSSTVLTFLSVVKRIQFEMASNLEHASMSGVEVMQELNRIQGHTFSAVAPFIFTTPIGIENNNSRVQSRKWMFQERLFSERVPHTACVNAIKEDPSGTACVSIDTVEHAFPIEVVEGVFAAYSNFISVLCNSDSSSWQKELKEVFPSPSPIPSDGPILPVPITPLHSDFLIQAHLHSAELAISQWDTSGSITRFSYLEISYISRKVCDKIEDMILSLQGSPKDTYVVAVVMDKGWEQVAATLGCLRAGCAYLPIDIRLWPEQRVRHVLKLSETNVIVSQKDVISRHPWLHEAGVLVIDVSSLRTSNIDDIDESMKDEKIVNPNSIAYLIYTSGSTGVPKGVCCHHRGTMNTITDLNSRFEIGIKDKVLALSSLSFDLSVYDIFGMLSAGGTVVIPPASSVSPPDPEKWLEIVIQEEITLWNTVPAFLELLISHCEYLGSRLPSSLRLVYLSGDWIPLTLPSRVRAISDNSSIRIISMGGATEAAIWSNIYEIGREGLGVPEGWSSVPYGRPLRNQSLLVLDDQMRHCEVWVTGYLHLGGVGVAQGYYRDPDRTAYQFVKHPVTGETLFRTGDLGRVRPGGLVEILGREDAQVKVNGFRVELGEIERALMTHNSVKSAAVAIHRSMLCAYVVLDPKLNLNVNQTDAILNDLRDLCKTNLAQYMVPQYYMALPHLPLSSNGKLSRNMLPYPDRRTQSRSISQDISGFSLQIVPPRNETEKVIRDIVSSVLKVEDDGAYLCCRTGDFFEQGGNSLMAIQLLHKLRIRFGRTLTVQALFSRPTVQGIYANIVDDKSIELSVDASQEEPSQMTFLELSPSNGSSDVPIILFNPAGASVMCYSDLVHRLGQNRAILALDDGAVLSGKPFVFPTIESVAVACLSIVINLARTYGVRGYTGETHIVLAGWSYGGVIATEVAKLLTGSNCQPEIHVDLLALFDAPLRPVSTLSQRETNVSLGELVEKPEESLGSESAKIHYSKCRHLLELYHKRSLEEQPLQCPILSLIPENDNPSCDDEVLKELTSSRTVISRLVPGSHWTMLKGDNAESVCSNIIRALVAPTH